MAKVVIHRAVEGGRRWFELDGVRYDVQYWGPDWGWSIEDPGGVVLVDSIMTLSELREQVAQPWFPPEPERHYQPTVSYQSPTSR